MKIHKSGLWALTLTLGCTPRASGVPESPHPAGTVAPLDARPAWLEPARALARDAGADAGKTVIVGPGIAGDMLATQLEVPAGRCALLYARGTEGLEDIDLLAFADDGSELGSDEAPDATPGVLFCPQAATRIYVSARVIQGRGLVGVGYHEVTPSKSDAVRRALLPRSARSSNGSAEGWPGMDAAVAARRHQLGGQWVDLRRVAIPLDSRIPARLSAEVPAHRCLDMLALPSDDISSIDLDVLDEAGRIVTRAQSRDEERTALVCTGDEKALVNFEARPQLGNGLAVFILSLSDAPRDDLGLQGWMIGRIAPPPAAEASSPRLAKKLALRVGSLVSVALPDPGCARVDFAPQGPLLGFQAAAWSKSGASLGELESLAPGPLFVCPAASGARLDLTALKRAGELEVQVQAAQAASPLSVALPLASSRLLRLIHDQGRAPFELLPKAKRVELSRDQLTRVELDVPRGRCLHYFVAQDSGAWGLELRVIERQTGNEVTFVRGKSEAAVTLCAERSAPKLLAAELRTSQGQAGALWVSELAPTP